MKIIAFSLATLLTFSLSGYAEHHQPMAETAAQSPEAQQVKSHLLVENPRAKSTIPGVKVSAGYLTLTNKSNKMIRLVEVSTPAAQTSEFHNMIMHNSNMVMRKVDSIEIKPQQSFEFKPKSYHLMFMKLNHPFIAGESITVTLVEDNGQTHDIVMPITTTTVQ